MALRRLLGPAPCGSGRRAGPGAGRVLAPCGSGRRAGPGAGRSAGRDKPHELAEPGLGRSGEQDEPPECPEPGCRSFWAGGQTARIPSRAGRPPARSGRPGPVCPAVRNNLHEEAPSEGRTKPGPARHQRSVLRSRTAPGQSSRTAAGRRSGTAPGQRSRTAPGQSSRTAAGRRSGTAPGQRSRTAPGQGPVPPGSPTHPDEVGVVAGGRRAGPPAYRIRRYAVAVLAADELAASYRTRIRLVAATPVG